jgi:quercetin dioxygenase-like cupin family protein
MTTQLGRPTQIMAAIGLVLVGGLLFTLLPDPIEPMTAQQSLFMGGSPVFESSEGVTTRRILFPAGVRSNWHSHTDGQLLMIEEGVGRTQVRGEGLELIGPGTPWWTAPGVQHWHGADVEEDALQLTIYSGTVDWMEPVTDDVYRADPGR